MSQLRDSPARRKTEKKHEHMRCEHARFEYKKEYKNSTLKGRASITASSDIKYLELRGMRK